MYYLIENGPIRWPNKEKHGFELSSAAMDIIGKLLCKDKAKRLGKNEDVDEVLGHPWFSDFKLEDLMNKKLTPPFIPNISKPDDTSHFDEKFSGLEAMESIIDPTKQMLIEKHKEDFDNF